MIILDKDNKPITENIELIKTWTEYCKDLYNFKIKPDNNLLKPNIMNNNEESLPILESEVRNAIRTLKNGKSPGPDNIPGELLKHGGESLIKIFTTICQQIWKTKKWPDQWTKSLIIPIPKKGDSRKCSNYRTLSLIPHASKILLRIILNRLNSQAETILAEEQAGFRKSRSTIEQILNCRILMEKHIENNKDVYHNFIDFKKAFDCVWHKGLWQSMYNFGISQDIIEIIESLYSSSTSAVLINNVTGSFFKENNKDVYHNFIDFKKAFDRVWHKGLWQSMYNFGISQYIIEIIESLYSSSTSAVLINNVTGSFFNITVGVRQGCLLSPVLFNIFLEQIMINTLDEYTSTISIGGRKISNLRFADDIDLIAGSNTELQDLTNRLVESSKAHGMEISQEKSKTMVNSKNNDKCAKIYMDGILLEDVKIFKYLGATLKSDGASGNELRIRIATATSAMIRLNIIWTSKNTSFKIKFNLYRSLVLSILLYGCETWTLMSNGEKRISAFENKAHRRLLEINYRHMKTNQYVNETIIKLVGKFEPLLTTIKRRKMSYYGHICRHNSLANTIMQGKVEGARSRGRPKKDWMSNITLLTNKSVDELSEKTRDRDRWRKVVIVAINMIPPTMHASRD